MIHFPAFPQRRNITRRKNEFTAVVVGKRINPKVLAANQAKMRRLQTAVMDGKITAVYLPIGQRHHEK